MLCQSNVLCYHNRCPNPMCPLPMNAAAHTPLTAALLSMKAVSSDSCWGSMSASASNKRCRSDIVCNATYKRNQQHKCVAHRVYIRVHILSCLRDLPKLPPRLPRQASSKVILKNTVYNENRSKTETVNVFCAWCVRGGWDLNSNLSWQASTRFLVGRFKVHVE